MYYTDSSGKLVHLPNIPMAGEGPNTAGDETFDDPRHRRMLMDAQAEAARAQARAAQVGANAQYLQAQKAKSYEPVMKHGGPVKDPRATRRDYAKGGPVFR